jgi:hypothetical protein
MTVVVYNMTGLVGNVSSIDDTLVVANTLTEGWFGTLLLITVVSILFMYFFKKTGDTGRSVAGASWIGFLMALILWTMGILPAIALWSSLVVAAASSMFTWRYK